MLSYHVFSMCVFLLYRSDYWHADSYSFSQSSGQGEQHTWAFMFSLAKAVRCISPSLWSVLPCQFSFPFIHISSPKTTFMTKHGLIPSKWCFRAPQRKPSAIPQRWKQRRRPFCSHGFWNGIEETLSREMREARHLEKICKGKGFLFLVWSEATGTGLHSQVPEQNRRNLSEAK